ncbi:MAG: ATP-binding protein [Myxococcales bacterium]|nr:ATP-binding protein [Myxococcales bacterium]
MATDAFVLAALKGYVARHGHRLVQADGRLSDLFVSLGEARNLIGLPMTPPGRVAQRAGWPSLEETTVELAAARAQLDRAGGTIARLRKVFGLDDEEVRLLVVAAAPYQSVDVGRLYTFAQADFTLKRPTVGFLAELVAELPGEVAGLVRRLRPDAPLVQHRLVRVDAPTGWGADAPLLAAAVSVPTRVLDELAGFDATLPPHLAALAEVEPVDWPGPDDLIIDPRVVAAVAAGVAAPRPRMVVSGPRGAGRRSVICSLARHGLRAGVVSVDLAALADDRLGALDQLAELAREATLLGAVLHLRADAWVDAPERVARATLGLRSLFAHHRGGIMITCDRSTGPIHAIAPGLHEVALPPLPPFEQRRAWAHALASYADGAALEARLADRFNLTPGLMIRAVREAASRGGGQVTAPAIIHAVRRQADHALSEVAEPFATTLTWDDVVLPDDVSDAIIDILSHAKHRAQVFDGWGFRRKVSYGRGLSCLFSGPPGTGKTMVAAVLAQTLERELYRIDLSRVTSKWVGETEKNLARVFDEAERAQVILLFDEADSLFSARTDVKSANDRFANNEINYLLQRMEAYDGMTILTTNLDAAIDPAFRRRIKFRVTFPMPEAAQRAMLWQSMLPPSAPVEAGLEFDELGTRYELSGGSIKNAVLRAAFLAADAGTVITAEHLRRAAVAEVEEMGRLVQ